MLTTGFDAIEKEFGVSLDTISSNLVGFMTLATGLGMFFTSAGAVVFGKRPIFIVSVTILLGTNAWGFFATVSEARANGADPTDIVYRVSFPLLS
jgi:hypothetical protein